MNIHKSWLFSFRDFYPRCWLLAHTSFRRTKFRTISAYYHHFTVPYTEKVAANLPKSFPFHKLHNRTQFASFFQPASKQASQLPWIFFSLEPNRKQETYGWRFVDHLATLCRPTTPIRLRSFDFHFGVVLEIFARSRAPLINGSHATLLTRVACDLSIKVLEWVYFWGPMVSIAGAIGM